MTEIFLNAELRAQLENIAGQSERAPIDRWARVVLLYDQGLQTSQVANQVGLSRSRTRYIKQIYLARGMEIFAEYSPEEKVPASTTETHPAEEAIGALLVTTPLIPAETQALEQTEKPTSVPEISEQSARPVKKKPPSTSVKDLAGEENAAAGEYIAILAGQIFDATQQMHQMGNREREMLYAAAHLARVRSKPKASQEAILAQPIQGFNSAEQKVIAKLVRGLYDRRSKPVLDDTDGGSPVDKRMLTLLAILRIAAALDGTGTQSTRLEAVTLGEDGLYLQINGQSALADATAAQSAATLWTQLTQQVVHIYTTAQIDLDQVQQVAASMGGPGIHPEDGMPEAGRKVLRYHFLQMLAHEPGTRLGEDIEELHDMRVATRRMRAAFEVFSSYLVGKQVKSLKKGLRAAGRALGNVRDQDVFMEKAGHYLESLPEDARAGLDPLMNLWSTERETARGKMLAHLDSPMYKNFVVSMNEYVNTPGMGALQFDPDDPHPYLVKEAAPLLIYSRLADVRAFSQILGNATYEQLHALRIRFKYLRYIVEFFREVLAPESKEVIEGIKLVQDHLGDLNDADVACGILQDFLEGWEGRQLGLPISERQNPEPLVQYLAYRTAERHRLLVTFLDVWHRFEDPEFLRMFAMSIAVL
jgi:CHAD domain-containing protein